MTESISSAKLYSDGLGGKIRQVAAVASLCSAMLLTQAVLGQTVIPIHFIAETFEVLEQGGQQSWFAASFSLTVGTFVLPAGRVGDMFGHKLMVIVGYMWLCIWSLIAGLSHYTHSYIFFDVCRAMQGISCAILLPNSLAILGRLFPPGSYAKHLSFSFFAATAPNGFLIGALFTCLVAINKNMGWPWGFYLLSIWTALLALLCTIVLPSEKEMLSIIDTWPKSNHIDGSSAAKFSPSGDAESHEASIWQRLDWFGCLTGVSGLILFNFAFNQALVVGWSTVYVYVLLLIGFLLICIFLIGEARVLYPLVPTSVFSLTGSLILICLGLGWASFAVWVFYLNLFQQNIRGYSALFTVATYIPVGFAGIIAAFSTAHIMSRTSPPFVMLLSLIAFCVGSIFLGTATVHTPALPYISAGIMPFGMDTSFPAASIILSDLLPSHKQGTASSIVNTIVNYSIALSLGFAGVVETHVNHGGRDPIKGYRGAFYIGIGFAGAGVFCALANMLLHMRPKQQSPHQEKAVDNA